MELEDAMVQAGVTRLRPILMTSLTTILGLTPLAVGKIAEAMASYNVPNSSFICCCILLTPKETLSGSAY